jgi:hypothetical protein
VVDFVRTVADFVGIMVCRASNSCYFCRINWDESSSVDGMCCFGGNKRIFVVSQVVDLILTSSPNIGTKPVLVDATTKVTLGGLFEKLQVGLLVTTW